MIVPVADVVEGESREIACDSELGQNCLELCLEWPVHDVQTTFALDGGVRLVSQIGFVGKHQEKRPSVTQLPSISVDEVKFLMVFQSKGHCTEIDSSTEILMTSDHSLCLVSKEHFAFDHPKSLGCEVRKEVDSAGENILAILDWILATEFY